MEKAGLRVEVDERSEKLGFKIREAQMQKVPYMAVIGQKEAQEKKLALRKRSGEQLDPMSIVQLTEMLQQEVKTTT